MIAVDPIKDVEQIEAMAENLLSKNERDYVMFMTGISTGLRIGDILSLRVRDVRNKKYIKIYEQKTDKSRDIIIGPKLKKIYDKYTEGKDNRDFLFKSRRTTKSGKQKPISRVMAYNILRKAAIEIGFNGRVGCHSMRKTFGYRYYKKNGNLAQLQKIFNHRQESITLAYIGLEKEEIDKNISSLW